MSTSNELNGAAAEIIDPLSATYIYWKPSESAPAINSCFNGMLIGTESVEIMDVCSRRLGTIDFQAGGANHIDGPAPPAKRNEFKDDFCREITRLENWAADFGWVPSSRPEFRVVVSDRYKISKSLVPAWAGRAGYMEFPLWRVAARKAAIMHELVHVFFPSCNRFLAEGLAVCLQAVIGGNPAFPNFGKSLHENVRERFLEMAPDLLQGNKQGLGRIHLAQLDAIATPNPLTLRVGSEVYGEDKRGQAFIYPIAGSFVQFLIETRGIEKFRAFYFETPLVPLVNNAGAPDRWLGIYDVALTDLENEWKAMIVNGFSATDPHETFCGTMSV